MPGNFKKMHGIRHVGFMTFCVEVFRRGGARILQRLRGRRLAAGFSGGEKFQNGNARLSGRRSPLFSIFFKAAFSFQGMPPENGMPGNPENLAKAWQPRIFPR